MEFNDFSRSKKTKCWILTLTDIIEGGFLGSKNSISTRDVMHVCKPFVHSGGSPFLQGLDSVFLEQQSPGILQ